MATFFHLFTERSLANILATVFPWKVVRQDTSEVTYFFRDIESVCILFLLFRFLNAKVTEMI